MYKTSTLATHAQ